MKYIIYAFLILDIGLLIYSFIYPKRYCVDINIHDTYYVFTYKPVETFLLVLSLLLYIARYLFKLVK